MYVLCINILYNNLVTPLFYFLAGLGRMPMVLQMMFSMTSSAPPPMEMSRMSLHQRIFLSKCFESGFRGSSGSGSESRV